MKLYVSNLYIIWYRFNIQRFKNRNDKERNKEKLNISIIYTLYIQIIAIHSISAQLNSKVIKKGKKKKT